MGQVVAGVTVDDLAVGDEVELVIETLYSEDDTDYLIWKWRPLAAGRRRADRWRTTRGSPCSARACTSGASGGAPSSSTGWPPHGDALADAGLAWRDVQFVSGADTIRNGYPGFVSGATFAQALGWTGARVSSVYAACASGAVAIANARAQILAGLCDVALVVGADTTPKGFFAPVGGDRKDDPDWLRFHLLGATNPTYFALYARRRMDRFGAHRGGLRAGQGEERASRPGQPVRALPQGGDRGRGAVVAHGGRPPAPARDLRHLRRRRGRRALEHGLRPPPRGGSRAGSSRSTRCRR